MCLPSGPSPMASFPTTAPAATQRTEYRWMPRPENPSRFYVCSVLSHFPPSPFHFIPPSPEPSAVRAWLQSWDNIFTFLLSFCWMCYVRKIPAAKGNEVQEGKDSKFQTKNPSSSLLCLVSPSTIHCLQGNHRQSVPLCPRWRIRLGPGMSYSRAHILPRLDSRSHWLQALWRGSPWMFMCGRISPLHGPPESHWGVDPHKLKLEHHILPF